MLVVGALLAETGLAILAPPHFYPFGPGKGDSMLPVSDDGSGEVTFTRSFPYYGVPRNKAWVCKKDKSKFGERFAYND